MHIDIQFRRIAAHDSLRWWIEGQLRETFAPCAARVRSIEVLLDDDNDQERGILCRIAVRGRRFREVVVTDRHRHLAVLVKSTARRAARAVSRRVNRTRTLRRSAPPAALVSSG